MQIKSVDIKAISFVLLLGNLCMKPRRKIYVSILKRKKCRSLKEQGWKATLPFSGVFDIPKFCKFREIQSEKGEVAKKMLQFQNIFSIKQSSKGSKSVKIPHIDCNAAYVCPLTKMASKHGGETTLRGGVARNKAQKTFHRWANTIELAVNVMIFELTLNLCSHSLIYLWFGVSLEPNATTNFEQENE